MDEKRLGAHQIINYIELEWPVLLKNKNKNKNWAIEHLRRET